MDKIRALTFKDKKNLIENIFRQYQKVKMQYECLEAQNFYPQYDYSTVREKKSHYNTSMIKKLNSYIMDKDELLITIRSFEILIDSLSFESRRVIQKDFIEEGNTNWWIDFYSRATYYRVKTRAMEEFLFYASL